MDPIRITPPRFEGELKWGDLAAIIWGQARPNDEFIRRMAYELLPEDKRP